MLGTFTTNTNSSATRRLPLSLPALLLRLEGLAVFAAAVALYAGEGASAVTFVALLLAPDLAALGYLINPRAGAVTYNLAHTYTTPVVVALLGLAAGNPLVVQLALIWFAHIGMDRLVGYGLKYPSAFKDTHLGRV